MSMIRRSLIGLLFFVMLLPAVSQAQQQLTLSVTPTLFEMSASPGQVWESSVKISNPNPYSLTVYPTVVNFAPKGEHGEGKFVPVFETESMGATLAEWISVEAEAIEIPREKSYELPVRITVPADAPPGGHFAAVLVGTKPPETEGSLAVRTSQMVTSLFFVRIAGDVVEQGTIRSFRVVDQLVDRPQADFELRFENKGNVHIQPQGGITITNMWGEERGYIPINHHTHFGNVLPDSVRQFSFSWEGEADFTEIGRYKAAVTLGYGQDERMFQTSELYFWVMPVKEVLITLLVLLAIGLFISWAIKAYIRRMLILSGINPDDAKRRARVRMDVAGSHTVELRSYQSISAPVRFGWNDLKQRLSQVSAFSGYVRTIGSFIWLYRIFFSAVLVALIVVVGLVFYVGYVSKDRSYEVVIDGSNSNITLTAEEISYQEFLQSAPPPPTPTKATTTSITIVNVSGTTGSAAAVKLRLEQAGYQVTNLEQDTSRQSKRTVVVFNPELQALATDLSEQLNGALPSATASSTGVTIYVGADLAISGE